jgi:Fic family protein
MRYQPIGLLRSQPKAIPSIYPLVTTADFIEAKKSNFDGINKRLLRAAIVKVLQKQAYMIHQMALTRFCLENSAAAKSIPNIFSMSLLNVSLQLQEKLISTDKIQNFYGVSPPTITNSLLIASL